MNQPSLQGTALAFAIHRTDAWWRYVASNMGFERGATVSDHRGSGDYNLVNTVAARFRHWYRNRSAGSALLLDAEVQDVIARCRVLRWLPPRRATALALAMADACEEVLESANPAVIVSFPIDRFTNDILARRARARGTPYVEVTPSALPGMSMLLYRGRLMKRHIDLDSALVEEKRHELADPLFTPAYVPTGRRFTPARFLRTFGYNRLRGSFFWLWSFIERNRLNCHYLDAQPFLGHKPRLSDIRIVGLVDRDWRDRMKAFPTEKRLAIPLQLFPEASIDYWVDDLQLVDYENTIVEIARGFSDAGFCVLVKDHPLQFGFRQTAFIERLKAVPNVMFVPYEVGGNELLSNVGASFAMTGTLGLQAALLGVKSITVPNYYTNDIDFVLLWSRDEVGGLPERVLQWSRPRTLEESQRQIVAELLKGSFDADYFSFRGFDPSNPSSAAAELGAALGRQVMALGPDGEDWHRRHGF